MISQHLNEFFIHESKKKRFSGAVLIAKEDEILLKNGYGFANYNTQEQNTASHIYIIGSLTKAFIALSILMMEQKGLLKTSDYLEKYIPEYPHSSKVTLHQILQHNSGLWCYLQDPTSPFWEVMEYYHRPEKLMEYMLGWPLDFEPGTQYKYTNSGYVLLGILIEKISGKTLEHFLEENIFNPLNMRNTFYDPLELKLNNKTAIGYDNFYQAPPTIAKKLNVSITYASGGIKSNIEDLYTWCCSLQRSQLLPKKILDKMFTPGLGNYGYGWWIDTLQINNHIHKRIWHWGCTSGYHGMISQLIDDKIIIIMLQNTTSPDLLVPEAPDALFHLHDGITSILFDCKYYEENKIFR
jgi:CubicO group peptidase (beta-lactamase class C family)